MAADYASVTNTNVTPILTPEFDRALIDHIKLSSPLVSSMRWKRHPTAATEVKVPVLVGDLPTARVLASEPDAFPEIEGSAAFKAMTIGLRYIVCPTRIKKSAWDLAGIQGAMADVAAEQIKLIPKAYQRVIEFALCGGDESGILFQVNGTPTTTTCPVKNLWGLSNEEIGTVLDVMGLLNKRVHASSGLGAAARNATAAKITAWTSTPLGSETITLDRDVQADGWANGDIIYLSRNDNTNRAQSSGDSMAGPCLGGDDYTLMATFQGLTAATSPLNAAKVYHNNNVLRDLTEDLLQMASSVAEVRMPQREAGKERVVQHTYYCHPYLRDTFAQRARQDRRLVVAVGDKMLRPAMGVEIEMTTFAGTPFTPAYLHPRNRLHGIDTKWAWLNTNAGGIEGRWLDDGAPGDNHRVSGGPSMEMVRYGYAQGAFLVRSGNFTIRDCKTYSTV